MKTNPGNYLKFILFVTGILTVSLVQAQWNQWRGPLRDGSSTETHLLKKWPDEGPKLAWVSDTVGEGFSSAICDNKVIYTTGKRDSIEYITAIDLKGKMIWQKEIGKALKKDWPESRSTPTLYKNHLYAVTAFGDVSCIDSRNGSMVWKINIKEKFDGVSSFNGFGESLLVFDDKVILSPCGKKTTLAALNCKNGETLWSSESVGDTNIYVSPVLVQGKGKKLILTSTQEYILALDAGDGKIVWKEKASTTAVPLPGINQVYFSGYRGGRMVKINEDLNKFDIQWTDTLKSCFMGGTVRIGNNIFGTLDRPGKGMFCIDWETGKLLAFYKDINSACLLAADGMIYSLEDRNGRVCLFKPSQNSIDLVSSFKFKYGKGPNIAHMSIANGLLFIRHGKYLMAYDIKEM
jgi:outer membrane protein assembly factor BamB